MNSMDVVVDLRNRTSILLKGRLSVPISLEHFVSANTSGTNCFGSSSILQQQPGISYCLSPSQCPGGP